MAQFSILLFIWSKVSVRGKVLASDFSVPCRSDIFPASAQHLAVEASTLEDFFLNFA